MEEHEAIGCMEHMASTGCSDEGAGATVEARTDEVYESDAGISVWGMVCTCDGAEESGEDHEGCCDSHETDEAVSCMEHMAGAGCIDEGAGVADQARSDEDDACEAGCRDGCMEGDG